MKVSEVQGCQGCAMLKVSCDYETKGRKVHHEGSEQTFVSPQLGPSLRVVIGEAPGETENQVGLPFIGAAGKFFDNLLRKAGIRREELSVLNCIQCQPPKNAFPDNSDARWYISESDAQKAIKQCLRNHVIPILESKPWTRLDILGNRALYWLTGLKTGILTLRGSPITVDTDEIKQRVGG